MGKSRVIFVRDAREAREDVSDDKPRDQRKDESVRISAISSGPDVSTKEVRTVNSVHDNQVCPEGLPSHRGQYAFQDTAFYRGIYPVVLPLRIFGLFPIPHISPAMKWCGGLNLWIVYSVVILVITVLHFARSLSVYKRDEDFGEELFFKLQQSLWYMECVVKTFATVTAWYRKDRLAKFFLSWASICKDAPPRKPVRHCAIFAAMSAVFFVVYNAAGCAFLFYGVDSLEHILMTTVSPLQMNNSNEILLKSLVVIVLTIMSAVAMFPVALMCVLMLALYHEFKDVSDTVSKSLQDNGEFIGDLEKLRLRHQKLCKLVQLADKTFSVIIAFAYMSNIPNLCIVLYSILYFRLHFSLALLNGFWFVFILVHVTTISLFGAWVNSAAHSPQSDIYSIRADSLSPVKQFEINLFLSKLTGDCIGLTALQMFVINRPTILTVGGLLLTYFVLLVQFKNSTVATCVCNVSGIPSILNGSSELYHGDL